MGPVKQKMSASPPIAAYRSFALRIFLLERSIRFTLDRFPCPPYFTFFFFSLCISYLAMNLRCSPSRWSSLGNGDGVYCMHGFFSTYVSGVQRRVMDLPVIWFLNKVVPSHEGLFDMTPSPSLQNIQHFC